MPVKLCLFCCPVVHGKRFFTTQCNICSSHKVSTSSTVCLKITQTILPYLITSPGNKVILEVVKGFTVFVSLLQCISNPINSTSLCIVQNCTADTPITSSSLFTQRGVTSCNTLHICVSNPYYASLYLWLNVK